MFGAGTTGSEVTLVEEQPGDREDTSGEPFVGSAGRLLDEALESRLMGIPRRRTELDASPKRTADKDRVVDYEPDLSLWLYPFSVQGFCEVWL